MPDAPDKKPALVKEPYEPPAVLSEEVFETLAAGCGKDDVGIPSCSGVGALNS